MQNRHARTKVSITGIYITVVSLFKIMILIRFSYLYEFSYMLLLHVVQLYFCYNNFLIGNKNI